MTEDEQLKRNVVAELEWEPRLTPAHIGVTAKNGVVALTGHVATFAEKSAAETAVGRVRGVKAIAADLEVKLPHSVKIADDEIAAAALSRFGSNASIPRDTIKVKVEKGWVSLSGDVDCFFQQDAATADVRQLSGVVGLTNKINIKPRVNVSSLSDNIQHALHRSWFFDPRTVNVTADGGSVKLTGTVATWHQRDLAASTAWAAPGATSVHNDINVVF